ncbi:MAG: polysaccharide pyruvyl transferase family protein [Oceanicoccus sp.]
MPLIIEVKGANFINKGGELMLLATIQQLDESGIDYALVIEPSANASFNSIRTVNAYLKLPFRLKGVDINFATYLLPKSLRAYLQSNFGIFMEPDVDAIFDISGFAYGDQWPSRGLYYLSKEISRFAKRRKKVFILPQALGPFKKKYDAALVKKYFPLASLVFPRDKTSCDHLTALIGTNEKITRRPDFTNLVKPERDQYSPIELPENCFLIIPNFNMLKDKEGVNPWEPCYVDILIAITNQARLMNFTPVLLNHEGKRDYQICKRIQEKIGFHIEILQPESALAIKAAIGAAKGVFSSRFHGCISALSQGIPCIGTSWSHKYDELYQEYEFSKFLISPDISKEDIEILFTSISDPDELLRLSNKSMMMTEQTQLMWKKVFAELERRDD